uniref:Cytoplasmic protein n=1 Tax=Kwoniella dejecticola CBS 10117 TaxID=1296121 RepID=A0A1A6A160_9TREE|nr:cytoplasmic protein [Kwoniella dejecticola CBS 10117]OBR83782.1 cytoplasmic protein [Kwoniella dejecticola CBS 10117]
MSKSPVIILTGASRGLGLAVLQLLLSNHNARVTTLSRSISSELQAVVKQYGQDRVLPIQGDVGRSEDNIRVVEETVKKWGEIDGLILNAGTIEPKKLDSVPIDSLASYVQTNLLSTIYLVQPALPHLRKTKGKVVLISSGASTTGYQAWGLYSMAKAGMNSLARTLAAEEKENEVAVFAIRPGMVNVSPHRYITVYRHDPLLRNEGPATMHPDEMVKFQNAHKNGELLAPEQPGSVIAGLAIDGSLELTGEYINWADDRLKSFQ